MQKYINKSSALGILLICMVIPLIIVFGVIVLNDRKYYLISTLIILCSMLPFFISFEKREPKVRELVIIAVLTGIAVAGRGAFFMIPQFKPVVAVVIISGVCFGGESGFLVGALSGFVSNFFFGQGPWTPWQMFCFGIIGFLAGILFSKGLLYKGKTQLCIFGFLSTFFIYGGIINIGSLIMFTSGFSIEKLMLAYVSAFWFDIIHATATAFFLYTISQTMIEKLDRIKVKYGLIEQETL